MVFTIHRYLFAALLVVIGLDVLSLNLAVSLLYFAGAFAILTVMRKGAALDFWSVLLKTESKLKAFLAILLSIVQVSLWAQVISVIKSGHAGSLDAEEMKALQMVQSVLPVMVALAVPGIFLLNKLKNDLLNQMVAKCSATISESKDKSILCEQLNRLIVVERYRKNMAMAELHSRRLLELMEERTHKVKKMARPKAKHVQARKCG
ncbi:hypothetical protein KA183_15605 [bacterium]|nr:hypothetical protein [bacterium]QQR58160.1 MAG: hypothetical protein IPG59_01330 [Candidatus Melainabacteria bacterium]